MYELLQGKNRAYKNEQKFLKKIFIVYLGIRCITKFFIFISSSLFTGPIV